MSTGEATGGRTVGRMTIDETAMRFRRAGRSGVDLPVVSLGLWQNFGDDRPLAAQREIVLHALDRGITHLDLANNYGPPAGSAERNLGLLLAADLKGLRDRLVLSTKAGYRMWPGPYGEHGSRRYLLASLDQSLARLGVDHVDIFYSHRFDPSTPLHETLGALRTALDSGRARYAGISSYSARRTQEALAVAADIGLPLLVHQPSYSMLNRWIEAAGGAGDDSLLDVVGAAGLGCIAFSPLAQGLLTGKYLGGVPSGSRAERGGSFASEHLDEAVLARVRALDRIARSRDQSLAQMALAWALRDERITSVLIGASSTTQLDENLGALGHLTFTEAELAAIDEHAVDADINLWAARSSDL